MIDDSTGSKNGVPLSQEVKDAMAKAGLPLTTPSRGDNGKAGDFRKAGTTVPNTAQQAYFADVASQGGAADVQGAQQAVRAGVLVARSGRQPAQ